MSVFGTPTLASKIINVGQPTGAVYTCIVVSDEELPAFKEAIRRACATWQDQPKSIRALNDLFVFGKVMENMS